MGWLAWTTFAIVAVGACAAVRRPIVGLLVYLWLDFTRPHDFSADAGWFRPMLIIGVVTVASAVWHHRRVLFNAWRTLLPFVTLLLGQ
jgi:hypothetical protein